MDEISKCGFGNRMDGTTKAVLQLLISDELLQNFSWVGTKEKLSFREQTNLSELIVCVIRKKFPEYSRE